MRISVALALGLVPALGSAAYAAPVPGACRANPHLEQARAAVDGDHMDVAILQIHRAHMLRGNCREQMGESYRLKAIVEGLTGDPDRCKKAFEILLALDPRFTLPPISKPTLKACFDAAMARPATERKLEARLGPPKRDPARAVLLLPITVTDPLQIADRVRIYFRAKGATTYAAIDLYPSEVSKTELPALLGPKGSAQPVEVIVHLLDTWDGVLFALGDAEHPLPVN